MRTRLSQMLVPLVGSALLFLGSGCAMFRASVAEVDVNQKQHMDADYDYTDMHNVTEGIVNDLLASRFLKDAPQPPVLMIAGIQNRTQQFADMKNLSDRMRTLLLQSGKARFINETRRDDLLKEQGYQAANATPDTQTRVGRQLGAKYMISGSFTEMNQSSPRQVRISKQEIKAYKLTFEVTDLESSEIVWTQEKEFARKESTPLIGW
ncbi:MAG: hypothetical protein NTY53_23360 [Kiritimatiellaeota bacterium]|nr:hypothetical protein [Kiritimatiellota bacterium]